MVGCKDGFAVGTIVPLLLIMLLDLADEEVLSIFMFIELDFIFFDFVFDFLDFDMDDFLEDEES